MLAKYRKFENYIHNLCAKFAYYPNFLMYVRSMWMSCVRQCQSH